MLLLMMMYIIKRNPNYFSQRREARKGFKQAAPATLREGPELKMG
jgi:hypothetical protein